MYIAKMASGCIHQEGLFVSSDDLDNISALLDEDKDLKEEIIHLFYIVDIFTFKFEKITTNQTLNILKACTAIQSNFERLQVCFLV